MTCKMCLERGKTWNGTDPKCAFPDGGKFSPENWNCATVNAIRDLCRQAEEDSPSVYCDDQWYCAIKTNGIDFEGESHLTLWISWYKHRGRTDAMWLLNEHDVPVRPTEEDCLAIINRLGDFR